MDSIYRQAAINALDNYCNEECEIRDYNWCPDCQYENFKKVLMALPTAQPERKKGKWMFSSKDLKCVCTVCWYGIYGRPYPNKDFIPPYNFCPNCGADMRDEDES